MNPILVVGAFGFAILLWLLLAFAFKPIGAFIEHIWGDAIDAMNDKNNKEEEKRKWVKEDY